MISTWARMQEAYHRKACKAAQTRTKERQKNPLMRWAKKTGKRIKEDAKFITDIADKVRKAIKQSRKSTSTVGACMRIKVDCTAFGLPGVLIWIGLRGAVAQPSCNECYSWELLISLDVDWTIPGDFFTGFALRGSLQAEVQIVEEPCAKPGADSTPYCKHSFLFCLGLGRWGSGEEMEESSEREKREEMQEREEQDPSPHRVVTS